MSRDNQKHIIENQTMSSSKYRKRDKSSYSRHKVKRVPILELEEK